MEKLKVFIYCRVLSEEARSLLEYQKDLLVDGTLEDFEQIIQSKTKISRVTF